MQTLRKTRALLGPGQAGKLALLAVLALVASVVEAAGALVVFALADAHHGRTGNV